MMKDCLLCVILYLFLHLLVPGMSGVKCSRGGTGCDMRVAGVLLPSEDVLADEDDLGSLIWNRCRCLIRRTNEPVSGGNSCHLLITGESRRTGVILNKGGRNQSSTRSQTDHPLCIILYNGLSCNLHIIPPTL